MEGKVDVVSMVERRTVKLGQGIQSEETAKVEIFEFLLTTGH